MARKSFSILLALCLVLSLLPFGTFAATSEGDSVTYKPASAFEDGKQYLIANGSTGSVYVVSNEKGSSRQLKGIPATVGADGKITLDYADAVKATFTAEQKTSTSGSDSFWLKNDGKYLYTDSSTGLRMDTVQTGSNNTGKFWHYKADEKNLLWYFKDTSSSDGYTDTGSTFKYYLTCTDGIFADAHVTSPSLADSDLPACFLFVNEGESVTPTTTPEPQPDFDIEVTPASSNSPEETAAIAVGDTLVIKVINGSSSSAYNYTVTLDNSDAAEVQGNATANIAAGGSDIFVVKGLADGNVDITIQNNGTYSVRKAIIHLTVGEGGSVTPPDPQPDFDIEVTPASSNTPEETAAIAVGDTLVIKVINGSSSSAYNYTVTLDNSDAAEVQGNATANIAAGGSDIFVVKGLADGNVDITIQNNGTYSVRKAIIHLTVGEGGSVTPPDPQPDFDIEVTPASSNSPEETAAIAVGDTLVIKVINGSSSSAYNYTVTLDNSDAAEVQGNATANIAAGGSDIFVVKGLADGNVDITIQNNGSYSVRKAIIHLTVGEGGSVTPPDPQPDFDIEVTPASSNTPEETAAIAVGDTLVIKVINGSSNSAYDYTVTLDNSDAAEIQGNATANIAAGGSDIFVVKGLADGNVDITIQNNGSYSVRKAIIHLTVGEGGEVTPPPTPVITDQVAVTPSTNHPEVSVMIAAGDTLTIEVTNGSSSTAYDFNASLSNSGVAEIQDSATVNIAAGGKGTFTVKGLADGTVDITIQNSNSYGSQYTRVATIHLTVEGEAPACTHATTQLVDAKAATCTEAGYTGDWVCTICGETVTAGEVIPATGHDWDDGSITKAATCTETGVMTYTCKNDASHTYTEVIPATGHSFGEWTVVTAATCTENGYEQHVCSACGKTETRVIEATGHGETKLVNDKAATCTEAGYTGDWVCKVCGETVTAGEVIPAAGHSFGEWTVVTAATCTENGYEQHVCSACGETETRVIEATGHGETKLVNDKAATCTEAGYTGDWVCKVCGETVTAGEVIPAAGHSFGEWTVVTAATCTENGSEQRVCSACGETETRVIPATGHGETKLVNDKAATCTEAGYTGDLVCKVCGEIVKAGETIPALGHDWGEWITVQEPTTTAAGLKERTCNRCFEKESQVIERLPEPFAIVTNPSDVTADLGDDAVFTVVATGEGLTYQWFYRSAGKVTWYPSDMEGSNGPSITVPVTEKRNGQSYYCVVTDENGDTILSDVATIYVAEPNLKITENPADQAVKLGTDAVFTVSAEGEGLTYQWQYRSAGKNSWYNSSADGFDTPVLTIPATEKRDGQSYRCIVTDSKGNSVTSEIASISILQPTLAIVTQPSDQSMAVGENAVFKVVASGDGLTYQWQYQQAGKSYWYDSGMTGSDTDTLTVPVTAKRDGQSYRCVITDADGNTVISEAATLTVAP